MKLICPCGKEVLLNRWEQGINCSCGIKNYRTFIIKKLNKFDIYLDRKFELANVYSKNNEFICNILCNIKTISSINDLKIEKLIKLTNILK